MHSSFIRGFSLVEALVALALVTGVSAAILPAIALSARLQRESAIETNAAVLAASRLESLKRDVAAGAIGTGGSLESAIEGWSAPVEPAFECRWQVTDLAAPQGARLIAVRVVPLAGNMAPLTIATVVPHE